MAQSFWERRDGAAEARLRNSYRVATQINLHKVGAANPDGDFVFPESWIADQYHLDQPGRQDIQVELTYDFGHQNAHFAEWQAYLRDRRPPLLVLWGKDNQVYSPSDADCYKKADPAAQVHMFSGGHFVSTNNLEAARLVLALDPARPRKAVPLIHVRPPLFGRSPGSIPANCLLCPPPLRGQERKFRPMTKQELIEKMQQGQAWMPGKRVKLDFGGEGAVMLDGGSKARSARMTAPPTRRSRSAGTTREQLAAGQMDGMTAFMMGKLKVEGDMSNAMQLQGVLSKLRS